MYITFDNEDNIFSFFLEGMEKINPRYDSHISVELSFKNGIDSFEDAYNVSKEFKKISKDVLDRSIALSKNFEAKNIRETIQDVIVQSNELIKNILSDDSFIDMDEEDSEQSIVAINESIEELNALTLLSDKELVESLYISAVALRDSSGDIMFSIGDISEPVSFLRLSELSFENIIKSSKANSTEGEIIH